MHFEYQIMKKTVFEYETLRMRDREFQTFSQLVLYLCIYVKKIGHVWKKNLNLSLRSLLNVMLLKKISKTYSSYIYKKYLYVDLIFLDYLELVSHSLTLMRRNIFTFPPSLNSIQWTWKKTFKKNWKIKKEWNLDYYIPKVYRFSYFPLRFPSQSWVRSSQYCQFSQLRHTGIY